MKTSTGLVDMNDSVHVHQAFIHLLRHPVEEGPLDSANQDLFIPCMCHQKRVLFLTSESFPALFGTIDANWF